MALHSRADQNTQDDPRAAGEGRGHARQGCVGVTDAHHSGRRRWWWRALVCTSTACSNFGRCRAAAAFGLRGGARRIAAAEGRLAVFAPASLLSRTIPCTTPRARFPITYGIILRLPVFATRKSRRSLKHGKGRSRRRRRECSRARTGQDVFNSASRRQVLPSARRSAWVRTCVALLVSLLPCCLWCRSIAMRLGCQSK